MRLIARFAEIHWQRHQNLLQIGTHARLIEEWLKGIHRDPVGYATSHERDKPLNRLRPDFLELIDQYIHANLTIGDSLNAACNHFHLFSTQLSEPNVISHPHRICACQRQASNCDTNQQQRRQPQTGFAINKFRPWPANQPTYTIQQCPTRCCQSRRCNTLLFQ